MQKLALWLIVGLVAAAGCASTDEEDEGWLVLEDGTHLRESTSAEKVKVPEGATVYADSDATISARRIVVRGTILGGEGGAGERAGEGQTGASITLHAMEGGILITGAVEAGRGGPGGDADREAGRGGDGGMVRIEATGPVEIPGNVRGGRGGAGGGSHADGRANPPREASATGGQGGAGGPVTIRCGSRIEVAGAVLGGEGGFGGFASAQGGAGRDAEAASGAGGRGGDVAIGGMEEADQSHPDITIGGEAVVRGGAGGPSGGVLAEGGDQAGGPGGRAEARTGAGGEGGALTLATDPNVLHVAPGSRLAAGEGGSAGGAGPEGRGVMAAAEALGGLGRPGGTAQSLAGPGGAGGRALIGSGDPGETVPSAGGPSGPVRAQGGAPEEALRPPPDLVPAVMGSDSGAGAPVNQAVSNGR